MTLGAARLPLCADRSRQLSEDPVGTAPHWQEVTVLELDVPVWSQLNNPATWTAAQSGVFEGLREKVEASGAGFGLLMSAPQHFGAHQPSGRPLQVRHYTLAASPTGGYARQDYRLNVPQSEWAQGLRDTLLEPHRLANWEKMDSPAGPDFQVCTHGTVDAACGKYGVPVYAGLRAGGINAWRTGHFGGHRFAATAVELPAGLLWAHLTPELALQVARREVAPADVRLHLRGYAGLPGLAQVLDRELLVQRGWEWLSAKRWAEISGNEVTLRYIWQGQAGAVRATVRPVTTLTVPHSSHSPEHSEIQQYQVQQFQVIQ